MQFLFILYISQCPVTGMRIKFKKPYYNTVLYEFFSLLSHLSKNFVGSSAVTVGNRNYCDAHTSYITIYERMQLLLKGERAQFKRRKSTVIFVNLYIRKVFNSLFYFSVLKSCLFKFTFDQRNFPTRLFLNQTHVLTTGSFHHTLQNNVI